MNDVITSTIEHEGQDKAALSQADQTWSQYVTFMVDERSYGIGITKVREIKGWSAPTELPNGPHAMRGVLNLRGVIVPIFDLRARFGQGETQASEEHVIIIVSLSTATMDGASAAKAAVADTSSRLANQDIERTTFSPSH